MPWVEGSQGSAPSDGFDSEAEAEALAEMLNRHRQLLTEFGRSPGLSPGGTASFSDTGDAAPDPFLEAVEAESAAIDRELEEYDRDFTSGFASGGVGAEDRVWGRRDGGAPTYSGGDNILREPAGRGGRRMPALSTPERGPVFRHRTAPSGTAQGRAARGARSRRPKAGSKAPSEATKRLRADKANLETRLESQSLALKELRRDARQHRRDLEGAAEEQGRLRASLQSARGTITALEGQLRALPRREARRAGFQGEDSAGGTDPQPPPAQPKGQAHAARTRPVSTWSGRQGARSEYEERAGSPTPTERLTALRRRLKEVTLRESQSTERAKALSQRLKDMSQQRDKAVKEREEAMQRAEEALKKAESFRTQFKMSQERAKREGERASLAKEGLVKVEERLKDTKAAHQSLQKKYQAATEKLMLNQQRLEGEQLKVKKKGEEVARAEAHARDLAAELHVYRSEKAMMASRRQRGAGTMPSGGTTAVDAKPFRAATSIDKAKARIASASPPPRRERPKWGSGGGRAPQSPAAAAGGRAPQSPAAAAGGRAPQSPAGAAGGPKVSSSPGRATPNREPGTPSRGKWVEDSDSDSDSDIDFDSVYRSTVQSGK